MPTDFELVFAIIANWFCGWSKAELEDVPLHEYASLLASVLDARKWLKNHG